MIPVQFTFDPEKSARNAAERGLPFERTRDYGLGECLYRGRYLPGLGRAPLQSLRDDGRALHVAVVTPRRDTIRIISFRRASRKEESLYEQETARPGRDAGR